MSNRAASTHSDRLELIETFIRIAETGGIGAAARSLDTTQPTVTRRLQQLEALLDAKLVERNNQGLSLTPTGATLLPEAREMAARWKSLEDLVGSESEELSGVVRVLSASEIGARLLPNILAEFMRRHPKVKLEAKERDSAADLTSDAADFALIEGKMNTDGVVSREIARSRDVLCAAPDVAAAIARGRGVSIARCEPLTLEGSPLVAIGSRYGATVKFQGRGGETVDVSFDLVAGMDNIDAALILALQGCGLALLPDWRAKPFIDNDRLKPVAADWFAFDAPVSLAWSPTRLRAAAASALMEFVREELPKLMVQADA